MKMKQHKFRNKGKIDQRAIRSNESCMQLKKHVGRR
jgi:hypothetical protein